MSIVKNDTKIAGTVAWIVILAILMIVIINPLIILFCWNYLMPVLFGLPVITFWQAFIMSMLSAVLFKPSTINAQTN